MYKTLLAIVTLFLSPAALAEGPSLAEQLQQLSRENGFELIGAEHAEGSPAQGTSGSPDQQIRILLENYAYVMLKPPEGRIRKLIIIGRKGEAPAVESRTEVSGTVVPTEKVGDQHMVTATLFGDGGTQLQASLLVDTGASLIILPAGMAAQLGLDPINMLARSLQTANGRVPARITRLPKVTIGEETVEHVETAFVDDEGINGQALLGMNVLKRFKVVLDGAEGTMTLEAPKDGKEAATK